MTEKPNGTALYNPRGRDEVENRCLLADALVASDADLFSEDNGVVWVTAGRKVPVGIDMLQELCRAHVVIKTLVETANGCETVYVPHEPDHTVARALLNARTRADGSLAARLPRAPSSNTRTLPDTLWQAVQMRLKSGEPAEKISRDYGVTEAIIKAVGRLGIPTV